MLKREKRRTRLYGMKHIPCVTLEQIRELDRLMVEQFNISLATMMERAGSHLAQFTQQWMNKQRMNILVCVGPGHNGGGGVVASDYLARAGHRVTTLLAQAPSSMKQASQLQLERLKSKKIHVVHFNTLTHIDWSGFDVVIDALLGYNMEGELHGAMRDIVQQINKNARRIISLDVPSGVWSDMSPGALAVTADATLAIALPKKAVCDRPTHSGEHYAADIGVPAALYERMHLTVPDLFAAGPIVAVD